MGWWNTVRDPNEMLWPNLVLKFLRKHSTWSMMSKPTMKTIQCGKLDLQTKPLVIQWMFSVSISLDSWKKKQINSYFSDMTDVSGMYEWPHSESETELNWPAIIIRFLEHNTTFWCNERAHMNWRNWNFYYLHCPTFLIPK